MHCMEHEQLIVMRSLQAQLVKAACLSRTWDAGDRVRVHAFPTRAITMGPLSGSKAVSLCELCTGTAFPTRQSRMPAFLPHSTAPPLLLTFVIVACAQQCINKP